MFEEGKHEYTVRYGVTWDAIADFNFLPGRVGAGFNDTLRRVFRSVGVDYTSVFGYDWARNDEWSVYSADAGVPRSVTVEKGQEVEVRQLVGLYESYTVYTDHFEQIVYDWASGNCLSGTGIFKDCKCPIPGTKDFEDCIPK